MQVVSEIDCQSGQLYSSMWLDDLLVLAIDHQVIRMTLDPVMVVDCIELDDRALCIRSFKCDSKDIIIVGTLNNSVQLLSESLDLITVHKITSTVTCCGLEWLSDSKCILIGVGNLTTKALSDTKCRLFAIDVVSLVIQAGLEFNGAKSIAVD
jgi:hypothetical protein